jgi:alpha-glucosidase
MKLLLWEPAQLHHYQDYPMQDHTSNKPGPVATWEHQASALLATHRQGLTRIDAVAADILRIRFSPTGRLVPARAWDPVQPLPPATLRVNQQDPVLRVNAGALQARIDLERGTVVFSTSHGVDFGEDLGAPGWREVSLQETTLEHTPEPELPAGAARTGVFLDKRMAPDEGYFGFGQRGGRLDRRRRRLTHWTLDPAFPGSCPGNDNLYQAHPLFMAVRPGLAWGLYLHSTWYSSFDAGAEREGVLTLFTLGGELDYYVFAGPTPAATVEQLARLTGRPALPPLWALGYHQSRWGYGSDAEVQAIAQEFRKRRIPLDAIHLDIDYMDGFRVFTWDRERFPVPAETVAALHNQGIRAVTIVDPGIKKELGAGYAIADSGVAGGHFVRRPDGELFSGWVWPGESLFPDFCRAATRRWWGDLHAGLIKIGVDGIWCDMNEPAIGNRDFSSPRVRDAPIPLSTRHGDDGEALQAETHNLYGSLMSQGTSEGLQRLRPEYRPWVLTRSGHVGVQGWAASWMGDNSSWWEHLQMSLPQLASMGLSGSPHVGVDIGGFFHNCSSELFARWMELGTFYPFMRCHTHHRSRPQEPWAFGPEVETIARAAIELRYRLLPYLYTLAHLAHRTGEPILRPLLYDFPEAGHLHQIEDQVMIGPQLMIAPVVQPGVQRRLVELPPGTWYDFRCGARVDPGPLITDAPLGSIPIFVRGGAILTLGNVRQSTAEPLTELFLEVYPDAEATGHWTLIEDDGETFAYRGGTLAETDFTAAALAQGAALTVGARRGGFEPAVRAPILHLHLPQVPDRLLLDGRETGAWRWDAAQSAVTFRLPDDAGGHEIEQLRD